MAVAVYQWQLHYQKSSPNLAKFVWHLRKRYCLVLILCNKLMMMMTKLCYSVKIWIFLKLHKNCSQSPNTWLIRKNLYILICKIKLITYHRWFIIDQTRECQCGKNISLCYNSCKQIHFTIWLTTVLCLRHLKFWTSKSCWIQCDHSPDNLKFPGALRHSSTALGMLSVTHIMPVLVLLSVAG